MYYWLNYIQDKIEVFGEGSSSLISLFSNTNLTRPGLGSNLDIRREISVAETRGGGRS